MKDLHPRFRWHTDDWLTRHLVLMHCQAKSRSFTRLGDDPDLKTYDNYMTNQRRKNLKELPNRLVLSRPKVSVSILCCQRADILES